MRSFTGGVVSTIYEVGTTVVTVGSNTSESGNPKKSVVCHSVNNSLKETLKRKYTSMV